MDTKLLNKECWDWIKKERELIGVINKKATVQSKLNSSILDL
jgi:hypothetical protein